MDIASKEIVATFNQHTDDIKLIRHHSIENLVVTVGADDTVQVYKNL